MKGWQNMLAGFCGTQRSRPLFSSSSSSSTARTTTSSQLQEQAISWSSSDEEEPKESSNLNSSVVVRLNFDTGAHRSSGLTKASVSRDVSLVQQIPDQPPKSPILQWSQRNNLSSDIVDTTQDEHPKSPVLEIRRRTSPVVRGRKRNVEKETEFRTPEKQTPIVSLESSPVFLAKRRKGQATRAKIQIIEIESQKGTEVDSVKILDSPVKTPEASQSSYINTVNSPIIEIKKLKECSRGISVRRIATEVGYRRENFEIVDVSQESRGAVPSIECVSSQDAGNGNVVTKTNSDMIQSISSMSEIHSTESSNVDDAHNAPFDPSQHPKKRPSKNGLLERLQKLKNRQRSHFRMWNHEKLSGKESKGQTLKITKLTSFGSKRVATAVFTESMKKVVLVLDAEQTSRDNIRAFDFIKIFPPWQAFDSSRLDAPVIMSLNLIEKIDPVSNFIEADSSREETKLKEFSCQCSEDSTMLPSECTSTLHKRGQDVLDTLLKPICSSRGSKLRAVEELESMDEPDADEQSQNQLFTIFDAVEIYAKKSTVPLSLRLACQRIFISRKVKKTEQPTQSSQPHDEIRLMLGQDANEVLCLVQLKGDFREQIREGCSYLLRGISLSKRLEISRKPDILGLLASLNSDGRQTMSIYKFSTSRGSSVENSVVVQPWVPPNLFQLSYVHKDTKARLSFAMHYIAQSGGKLYCSNSDQMTQAIPYLVIQVKAQAVIPKLTVGSAIFLRDLNCTRGDIFADEFTMVQEISLPSETTTVRGSVSRWISEKLQTQADALKNLKPIFPNLSNKTEEHQLVNIKGTICAVDEENSYSWPVCANCSSEFLHDLPDGTMFCSICKSDGPFKNMVSLGVYICPADGYRLDDSRTKVLVKLLQKTAEFLLPGRNDEEEYGLEAVLGQQLGPILCKCNGGSSTVSLTQVPYNY